MDRADLRRRRDRLLRGSARDNEKCQRRDRCRPEARPFRHSGDLNPVGLPNVYTQMPDRASRAVVDTIGG